MTPPITLDVESGSGEHVSEVLRHMWHVAVTLRLNVRTVFNGVTLVVNHNSTLKAVEDKYYNALRQEQD